MNNSVGYARPTRFSNPIGLGTDGIGANMIDEFRIAFVKSREEDVTATPELAWSWLETGWDLVPEARDDQVTWTYSTMEPWHLAYTTTLSAVDVDIDGEPALRGGRATRVDPAEVRSKAAEQAQRLFSALDSIS